MPEYIDGFVLVIPKKKVDAYKKIATKASKIWRKYGALDYRECVGEDLNIKMGMPFGKLLKVKPTETVVFAWITYKSRKHRDTVNKKVISDPAMEKMCNPENAPFDIKRMSYGGFETIVK